MREGLTPARLLSVLSAATTVDCTVALDSFGAQQFTVSYPSAGNASGDFFHYMVVSGRRRISTSTNFRSGTRRRSGRPGRRV
jgi:hypothetical protein